MEIIAAGLMVSLTLIVIDGWITDIWIEGREPVFVVNPAGDGARVGEAKLPMEFEFALTAIWRVERPGPWVALYDLR